MNEQSEAEKKSSRTLAIRKINDAVRACAFTRVPPVIDDKTVNVHIAMASGLGERILAEGGDSSPLVPLISEAVANFTDFEEENDPYGEHDYGAFKVKIDGEDRLIMFKIDYYNMDLSGGSEDPADTEQTTYVLTIFYAEDY